MTSVAPPLVERHRVVRESPPVGLSLGIGATVLMPFVGQWALGGLLAGGGLASWSLLGVFWSLTACSARATAWWWRLFLGLVLVSGGLEWLSILEAPAGLDAEMSGVLFFFNLVLVASGLFAFALRTWRSREDALIQLAKTQVDLRETEQRAHAASERAAAVVEAKNHFLAMVSHEIRTPLNGVIGLSHLALGFEGLQPRQRKYITESLASAEGLLAIINDLLDFSKIESGKMQLEVVDFQLDDVLDHVGRIAGTAAGQKGLEFVVKIDDVPQALVGDPTRLGQTILNLVTNAIKFTDEGEVLLLVRTLSRTEDSIEIEVSVKDSGIGIAPEAQIQLFEAFVQADDSTTRRFGGTGLGLSITQHFVELMDGRIWVESTVGQGSTFTFVARLGWRSGLPGCATYGNVKGLRALVVDDNPSAQTVMTGYLRGFDMLADTADTAEDALRDVEEQGYDVVLTDLKMPGIDGIDLIHRLRNNPKTSASRIVLVTGMPSEVERSRAEEAGADAVLVKPVRPSELLDLLMSLFVDPDQTLDGFSKPRIALAFPGVRALIVEDNEINQKVLSELLKRAGFEVTVVNNGRACCETLRAAETPFEVVLMDIQMPIMDGFEATRTLREDFPGLPVIGVTAHALMDYRTRCLDAGMNDVITKPIHPELLFSSMRRWLNNERVQASLLMDNNKTTMAPRVKGMDCEQGLARTGGNLALYLELLRRFRTDYIDAAAEIRSLRAAGSLEEGGRLAHTLKGVAGNIGVQGIETLLDDLQRAWSSDDESEVAGLLASLETVLQSLAPELRSVLDTDNEAPPTEMAACDVAHLQSLIRNFDSKALDYFQSTRDDLATAHDEKLLDKLADAIASYDFDTAVRLSAQLED